MTDDQLAAIKARCERLERAQAVWAKRLDGGLRGDELVEARRAHHLALDAVEATARTDIPALVAEVERLTEERDEAKEVYGILLESTSAEKTCDLIDALQKAQDERDQAERERDEARTGVVVLDPELKAENRTLFAKLKQAQSERDEAIADMVDWTHKHDSMKKQRDEARAQLARCDKHAGMAVHVAECTVCHCIKLEREAAHALAERRAERALADRLAEALDAMPCHDRPSDVVCSPFDRCLRCAALAAYDEARKGES